MHSMRVHCQTVFNYQKHNLPELEYGFTILTKTDTMLYGCYNKPREPSQTVSIFYKRNLLSGAEELDSTSEFVYPGGFQRLEILPDGDLLIMDRYSPYFYIYHTKSKAYTKHTLTNDLNLASVYYIETNRILFFNRRGCYEFKDGIITKLSTYSPGVNLAYVSVNNVLKYNGDYYFVTDWKLYRSNILSITEVCDIHYDNEMYFLGASLQLLNNTFYIATTTGLLKYGNDTVKRITTQNSNLKSNKLSSLRADDKGDLWFISSGGNGLASVEMCNYLTDAAFDCDDFKFLNFPIGFHLLGTDFFGNLTAYAVDPTDNKRYFYVFNTTKIIGLKETSKMELKVYPNPASDYVRIESNRVIQSIGMYNLEGKEVQKWEGINVLKKDLEVSNYAKGTYFLHLKFEKDETELYKFQITH